MKTNKTGSRSRLLNLFIAIKSIVAKNKLIICLFALFIFFRFFRLEAFVTFLGDQGRDVIILKRIVTFEHFPAIGAPSSVGMVYLGPFYYYLMAPFLFLAHFHPVGPAFGVALLSIAGLIAVYVSVRKGVSGTVALFFLLFFGLSAAILDMSRYSWNPNLLPFFAFLTLVFFSLSLEKRKRMWAALFGTFFSLSIQLHYLAVLLVLPMILVSIPYLNESKQRQMLFRQHSISFLFFLLFTSPLILFDLKHDFINSKNLIHLFVGGNLAGTMSYADRFMQTLQSFFTHIFNFSVNPIACLIVGGIMVYVAWTAAETKKNLLIKVNILNLATYIIAFAFLNSSRYIHYYGAVYGSFFLILAYVLSEQKLKNISVMIMTTAFIILYGYFNLVHYSFLFQQPNHQIEEAQTVAQSIIDHHPSMPYQIVSLPSTATDDHIRYFLELWNKRPLPSDAIGQPTELYILCHLDSCDALNDGQWQVAAFKDKKVQTVWKTAQGITVYKIIHGI